MADKPKIEIAGCKESKFWWIVKIGIVNAWNDNKMHDNKRDCRNEAKAFIKYCLTDPSFWPDKFKGKQK